MIIFMRISSNSLLFFITIALATVMLHLSPCFGADTSAAFVSTSTATTNFHMGARMRTSLLSAPTSPNSARDNLNPDTDTSGTQILEAIGVPETIQHLEIGQCLRAFRRSFEFDADDNGTTSETTQETTPMPTPSIATRNFVIERLSTKPNIFHLHDFLSPYECDAIIEHALNDNTKMTNAETITDNDNTSRKRCQVAWISSSTSNSNTSSNSSSPPMPISSMVSNLVSSTANIFLSKDVLQHESASVEDLQVLKYDVGGEFVLHHDGEPRILTIIYYVNGVAGTWFPLAQTNNEGSHINEEKFEQEFLECRKFSGTNSNTVTKSKITPQNKAQALQLGKGFIPGKNGLLVKGVSNGNDNTNSGSDSDIEINADNKNIAWVKKGDAIAFYNYQNDGSGKLDWRSLHTGLPTEEKDGTKWIANHWFRLGHLCDI